MGSQDRAITVVRQDSAMSWTWRGFWRDDPVFRFKNESFFQSGRHKAEERFWVNYIHNDGSYTKQTRARHMPEPPSSGDETDKDEHMKQESSIIKHPAVEDTDAEVLETKDTDIEKERENVNVNDNNHITTG